MSSCLAGIPLLRDIPSKVLREAADVCALRRFAKGETIFDEGEPASSIWIVKQGWVYLVAQSPQGVRVTIFVLTPEEALCGISAFGHRTYSAGAVAATDSQLVKIPAAVFADWLPHYPVFARHVLLACCGRIRHTVETLRLAQAPVEHRLAHTLLRLREAFGNTIPLTHHELACMAGTRWETSIRTLSAMKRRGWIASSRAKITIVAPQPLEALVRADTARG